MERIAWFLGGAVRTFRLSECMNELAAPKAPSDHTLGTLSASLTAV